MTRFYLASASPRRSALLREWGVPHACLPSRIPERIRPDREPALEAEALAAAKLKAALSPQGPARRPCFGLGADTIVVLDGRVLGKPVSSDDALTMLMRESGRLLEVVTGVAVGRFTQDEEQIETGFERSWIEMRPFSRDEALAYCETGEPLDKAGGFGIQGGGRGLIASYSGSHSNIVGLPRDLTLALLRRVGFPDQA